MMRMSGRVTSCCVALFLALASVSAVQRLNSINDLKKINFGQSVPRHSLLLLHWFANVVNIDNNNVIRLTFYPNNEDYGSHHYGNYERLLDPLPHGQRYYTVGNLNQETSVQLPSYVVHPRTEYVGTNRDRIIFRVREQNTGQQALQRIDRVYITQHYEAYEHQGTRYDPQHTYQVTTNLLREIRLFSLGENQQSLSNLRDHFGSNADDSQLRHIRNTWGKLACLGLLVFIVIQEKYSIHQHNNRPQRAVRRNKQPDFVVNIPDNTGNYMDAVASANLLLFQENQREWIKLAVTTGRNGNARILWNNIPEHRLKEGVMVVLFKNNDDQEASRTYESVGNRESGSCDTSVPLNDGLQARLHKVRRKFCLWKGVGEEICRGTEFKNPTAVNIVGYNARLQLFVKDGTACVRLFVKKTFSEWRSEFEQSWVGFYTSADKATNDYKWWQWQWATKFRPSTDVEDSSFDVYEYHSGMAIAPGIQARFILRGEEVIACTPSWR
ncbi:uncharacterized protein LOC120805392 [Xiphias gladius]|uniref:uncharacterized protein LOC120805392 n=1 Tax=Xiphias gladius TaxID=8245 RepID=UPI001A98B3A8|nr:uncharacterized protein LOC120805392 [Xiphias gladius]